MPTQTEAKIILARTEDREVVTTSFDVQGRPSVERHASKALLYAVAMSQLIQNGVLDQIVDALLVDGPISEIDATNRLSTTLLRNPHHHDYHHTQGSQARTG